MTTPETTSSRAFRLEDQLRFARLSGDYNPLHVAPDHARRQVFGATVVHGIHLVLWGLDHVMEHVTGPAALRRVKAAFRNALPLDEPVCLENLRLEDGPTLARRASEGTHFAVEVAGRRCSITGEFCQTAGADGPVPVLPRAACDLPCQERSFTEACECEGRCPLYLDPVQLQAMFPEVAMKLPAIQVAHILATTRLTGMECPGLHSVFESLELRFRLDERTAEDDNMPGVVQAEAGQMSFRVSYSDDRFRLIRLRVRGPGVEGELSTLFRPPTGAAVQAKGTVP